MVDGDVQLLQGSLTAPSWLAKAAMSSAAHSSLILPSSFTRYTSDRIPADLSVRGGNAEEIAFVRRRHNQAQDHEIGAGDNVLLDRLQVRERPDEDAQQTGHVRSAAHRTE
jgi:hypothetical protein